MPDLVLAVETSTSPEKYQSKTSATPSFASATYPSRDIDMIATTLVMVQLLSRQGRGSFEKRRRVDDERHCTHEGKRNRRAVHKRRVPRSGPSNRPPHKELRPWIEKMNDPLSEGMSRSSI
jgi:hypothetical protein